MHLFTNNGHASIVYTYFECASQYFTDKLTQTQSQDTYLGGFLLLPSLAVSLKNSTTLGTWLHALRPHFQVPLIGPIYSCSEQDSTNFIRDWRRDSQWAYHIQSEGFTILELPCCSFRSCHTRLTDGRCSNFILHDLIYLWDQLWTYFVLTLLFCVLNTVYNSCT